MSTTRIVWINGAYITEGEAHISPFDHGVTVGDGAFETLVTYRGTPFAFSRHYERLLHSLKGLGLEGLPREEVLFAATCELLKLNKLGDPARVRITVTGGMAGLCSERLKDAGLTVLIAVTAAPAMGEFGSIQIVPYPRNERSAVVGLKTTSYAENVVALAEAMSKGATEAILPNTVGKLCEGTGSNIFFVEDGVLITPSLESGALSGITRALTLKVAKEIGIPCEVRDVPVESILNATEAFLTSTTREVQPIKFINRREISIMGETTQRLRQAFKDMVAKDLNP